MDTGVLYIPNLNAIPLFSRDRLPGDNYSIKYEQSDMTCIQMFCINAQFTIKVYVRDISDKKIAEFPVNVSSISEGAMYMRFYTSLVKFAQISEGGYYIDVSITSNAGSMYSYYSPCIDVRKEHEKTFLIEYFNSENANNVLFSNGASFALRAEGGFISKSYIPKAQETAYQNQSVEFKLLQSIPYNSNTLTVGREKGVPDWLFDKVHRALSCDNVIIDSVSMTKTEGAAWSSSEEDGYDFRAWKIELVQSSDNISRPVIAISETIEFTSYVCQAQSTGIAFAKTATYKRYQNDVLKTTITKSMLTDVSPTLTETQYKALTVASVEERRDAIVKLFNAGASPIYLSDAIISDANCLRYEFTWSNRICQTVAENTEIVQTSITTGSFESAALGQDNKLYFGSTYNTGIWRLNNDGSITQTNITTGYFKVLAIGQNGKLFFGSTSRYNDTAKGIWYLDNDGQIKQSNQTTGAFECAVMGGNGKLYFGSASDYPLTNGIGIRYLDNDGQIKSTSISSGVIAFAVADRIGSVAYFGTDYIGVRYLAGGDLYATNQDAGSFSTAAMGQSGDLYITGGAKVYRVKIIAMAYLVEIATGAQLLALALGQDNKLYFGGGSAIGVRRLDDDDTIQQTNLTTGSFESAALGQDNKLYFGDQNGGGISYLADDGQIKASNITTGNFKVLAIGQDNCLYFGSTYNTGIMKLAGRATGNTGNAIAKKATLKTYNAGTLILSEDFNMLTAFGQYPPITDESEYSGMLDGEITARANALMLHIATTKGISINNKTNSAIERDETLCPPPD